MNREGAEQALAVARARLATSDYPSAVRFAKKSQALHPTPEAAAVLKQAEAGGSASSASAGSSSATSAGPSAGSTSSRKAATGAAKEKEPAAAANGGAHTPAQAALVTRVKKCKVTAYYEILQLERKCDEGAIKKAYRKLALGLHPDKNLAPGAEEAFKMVSKAFTVLSDPQKRNIYDQTGGDPESRGGGGGGGGGGFSRNAGFPSGGGFGGGAAEELSPEDLFRFFFGQGGGGGGFQTSGMGMGGSPFGGGGPAFQFFGPGMGQQQAQQRRQGGQQGGQQQGRQASAWVQMAPLLLLFAFSFLTQLPGWLAGSAGKLPEFSFDRTGRFSHPRTTLTGSTVQYFVDPQTFPLHPTYRSFVTSNPTSLSFSPPVGATETSREYREALSAVFKGEAQKTAQAVEKSRESGKQVEGLKYPSEFVKFERQVLKDWVQRLHRYCQGEINRREEALDRARGFLGIGTDYEAIARITNQRLEHCEKLSKVPGYGHISY